MVIVNLAALYVCFMAIVGGIMVAVGYYRSISEALWYGVVAALICSFTLIFLTKHMGNKRDCSSWRRHDDADLLIELRRYIARTALLLLVYTILWHLQLGWYGGFAFGIVCGCVGTLSVQDFRDYRRSMERIK